MGILTGFRLAQQVAALPTPTGATSNRGIRSPWTTGQLEQVVWADILGTDAVIVSRAVAMKVPAVAKARQVLVSAICHSPLVALDATGPVASQPAWLQRTDGAISPWHRMAWTVDDILFAGWSLWAVARDASDAITEAGRVPPEWWNFNADGNVEINGVEADPDTVLLIPGPFEGLLETADRTIQAARNIETAWAGRVRNPIPAMELHQTTADTLTDDEITDLLDTVAASRLDPNGALMFTPVDISLIPHGADAVNTFVEARNAIRLDVANFAGLPAAALDGSLSTASLTYVTQDGKRSELAESARLYAGAIEGRLSQDDVVPAGVRVRFDTGDDLTATPSPTGPTTKD